MPLTSAGAAPKAHISSRHEQPEDPPARPAEEDDGPGALDERDRPGVPAFGAIGVGENPSVVTTHGQEVVNGGAF